LPEESVVVPAASLLKWAVPSLVVDLKLAEEDAVDVVDAVADVEVDAVEDVVRDPRAKIVARVAAKVKVTKVVDLAVDPVEILVVMTKAGMNPTTKH